MRKTIIAGNWKMFKTVSEAESLVHGLKNNLFGINNVEIVVCPPYTCLSQVINILRGSNIKVGAQDMHWEKQGAFTGEISPLMLCDLSCQYVIVGHSERRQYFGETNETVNKKAKTALAHNLIPIVCVGEKLEERQKNKTFEVIENHVREGLVSLSKEELKKVVIAYEPVWAIGTGLTAKPEQAEEVHAFIRKILKEISDTQTAESMTIQYGGSVKPDNIKELIKQKNIDGALVGGASLEVETFSQIVKNCSKL